MPESSTAHTVIHPTSQQLTHVDENFNPTFIHTLKQISSSQVLHMLAQERSWLAASEVTKAIVIGLERKQLLIATEEVGWLGLPVASLDDNAAGEAPGPDAISVYPVLRKTSGKWKCKQSAATFDSARYWSISTQLVRKYYHF